MSAFLNEPVISPLEEPRHFVLVSPLEYASNIHKGLIVVPSGFDTDGASIPMGFRWLFPFGGKKMAAAIVHDYLYRTGLVDKATADKIFKEAMQTKGVSPWRIKTMYNAVKYFGGVAWKQCRERRA